MAEATILTDLIGQLPVVGAVILVVFYFLREMDRRDTVWREFLNEQNERDEKSTDKLASAINELRDQVAKNTALMMLHDAAMRGQNTEDNIDEMVKKILE